VEKDELIEIAKELRNYVEMLLHDQTRDVVLSQVDFVPGLKEYCENFDKKLEEVYG